MKAEELRLTETGIRESLRSVIMPLWNAYSFFVTYANIDGWSPRQGASAPPVHRLDRWILSELQTLVHVINEEMEAYRLYRTVPAMVQFVEKLTNWYIRRSRRRFWKSEDDADKASAYATLYRVLVTFSKSLAPILPFITESIYRNLVVTGEDGEAPESIHLCDMPLADESLRDPDLETQMKLAVLASSLGRSLRSRHNLKIRQPLRRLFLLPPDENSRTALEEVSELIADELNVKEILLVEDETEISEVSYKANFRALGPRFGRRMKEVAAFIADLDADRVTELMAGGALRVAGGEIGLDDIEIQRRERGDVIVAVEDNLAVGLDIQLDEELILECGAREFVNRVQNMRKDAGLGVSDRIQVWAQGEEEVERAVAANLGYVAAEVLAVSVQLGELPARCLRQQEWDVNGHSSTIAIDRAA